LVAAFRPKLAAIVTKSASESAFILRITWPLCAFTVIFLMPSSAPIGTRAFHRRKSEARLGL
jgi:hypothetical protein